MLWGNLLVAFSVLRCLTYFFLWLGPPRSMLPSRPPTEALGSFFLACGGLSFMFSTEELTIAAMRRGRDGTRHRQRLGSLLLIPPLHLRCHDVPQRRRCAHLSGLHMDCLCRGLQRLPKITNKISACFPQLSIVSSIFDSFNLLHF